MFSKLWSIFSAPDPLEPVTDSVLGTSTVDDERQLWLFELAHDDQRITISVGGSTTPDPGLLDCARSFGSQLGDNLSRVSQFVCDWASSCEIAVLESEVRNLRVEEVMFAWPDHADSAIVFFAGPPDGQLWRCHYADGQFDSLRCDG